MTQAKVVHADCLAELRAMAARGETVQAIVTDPPAGISFMGRAWDGDKGGRDHWVAWMRDVAAAALAVVPPGGHALVWALPRTSHWTATAWEDAGWECRDRIAFLFGTGFPKNANALKPACEDWWLLRKPLAGTVAQTVQAHGTGALNIDATRVATDPDDPNQRRAGRVDNRGVGYGGIAESRGITPENLSATGRWPANVTHDGSPEVLEAFAAFGERAGAVSNGRKGIAGLYSDGIGAAPQVASYADTGTAARFFYSAKASKADRAGSTHPTVKPINLMRWLVRLVTPPGGTVLDCFAGSGTTLAAATLEGFASIGIEQSAEYVADINTRLAALAVPVVAPEPDLFAALAAE